MFMKQLLKKQWPILGLCTLLAVVAFYLYESREEIIQETLIETLVPPGEGLILKDIQYAQENPDKGMTWALDASEMKSSGDKNSISFKGFQLKVHSKHRPSFELKGKEGDYSRDSGEINLRGDLEGISSDGYRFLTDEIQINEKSERLSSDRPIKISGPFFSVEGQGLYVDLKKETLKILSNVTAVINMEHITK